MVRHAVLLFAVALSGSAAAAQLRATLNLKESRIGEPVQLQVQASGKGASLAELDLGPLRNQFEVFSITRSGDDKQVRLEATLYPLKTGMLTVPAFAADGVRSKPLMLQVRDDPDLRLGAAFSPNALFERQGSVLLLSIRDQADRQWTVAPRLDAPGLLLRPLGERQYDEGVGSERATVREARWEVLGLKPGHHVLQPPMLDGYRLGVRLRLPLPVAVLEVRPLPAYLPVAVPVGKPQVAVDLPADKAEVGQPLQWTLHIAAPGFTSDAARAMLRLPHGEQGGLRFYPTTIREGTDTDLGPRELRIEITAIPTRSGSVRLPDLVLPYFDPVSQRLEQLSFSGRTLTVNDPMWRKAGAALAVLALLAAGTLAFRQARLRWQAHRARQLAWQRVTQATTAADLARAVCACCGTPPASTLRQWLARNAMPQPFVALVEELEQAQFGASSTADLVKMKQRWLDTLKACPHS